MHDRTKKIHENEFEILFLDYSGLTSDEFIEISAEAQQYIFSRPRSEVIPAIIDITDTVMTQEIKDYLKAFDEKIVGYFGKENKHKNPVAIIGLTGLQKILANVTVRAAIFFDTMEDAKQHIRKRMTEHSKKQTITHGPQALSEKAI